MAKPRPLLTRKQKTKIANLVGRSDAVSALIQYAAQLVHNERQRQEKRARAAWERYIAQQQGDAE